LVPVRSIFSANEHEMGSGKQDFMQADGGGLEHCNSNSNAHENSKMDQARPKIRTVEKM
jgi:hypothetical protein